ncbi:hypothetical protein PR048_007822 [Dryococelus australis]|uniref:Uncharacterized protein n=1 Tax=Dryococelus australis TaxID=614101 RepID=A0ABQ9HVI4_9NEOP|nr:hypothetical protein PR048_007822 [Dryococelus australis]
MRLYPSTWVAFSPRTRRRTIKQLWFHSLKRKYQHRRHVRSISSHTNHCCDAALNPIASAAEVASGLRIDKLQLTHLLLKMGVPNHFGQPNVYILAVNLNIAIFVNRTRARPGRFASASQISRLKTGADVISQNIHSWPRCGKVVRLLASHQGEPGSIPGGVAPRFSNVTMPLLGGFSRGHPVSPAVSFHLVSILISITLIGSQDLAALEFRVLGMENALLPHAWCSHAPAACQADDHTFSRGTRASIIAPISVCGGVGERRGCVPDSLCARAGHRSQWRVLIVTTPPQSLEYSCPANLCVVEPPSGVIKSTHQVGVLCRRGGVPILTLAISPLVSQPACNQKLTWCTRGGGSGENNTAASAEWVIKSILRASPLVRLKARRMQPAAPRSAWRDDAPVSESADTRRQLHFHEYTQCDENALRQFSLARTGDGALDACGIPALIVLTLLGLKCSNNSSGLWVKLGGGGGVMELELWGCGRFRTVSLGRRPVPLILWTWHGDSILVYCCECLCGTVLRASSHAPPRGGDGSFHAGVVCASVCTRWITPPPLAPLPCTSPKPETPTLSFASRPCVVSLMQQADKHLSPYRLVFLSSRNTDLRQSNSVALARPRAGFSEFRGRALEFYYFVLCISRQPCTICSREILVSERGNLRESQIRFRASILSMGHLTHELHLKTYLESCTLREDDAWADSTTEVAHASEVSAFLLICKLPQPILLADYMDSIIDLILTFKPRGPSSSNFRLSLFLPCLKSSRGRRIPRHCPVFISRSRRPEEPGKLRTAVHHFNDTSISSSVELCRNEGTGETGDPRENRPIDDIVRHYSHLRKSGDSVRLGVLPKGGLPNGELPNGDLPDGVLPNADLPDGVLPDGKLPSSELPVAICLTAFCLTTFCLTLGKTLLGETPCRPYLVGTSHSKDLCPVIFSAEYLPQRVKHQRGKQQFHYRHFVLVCVDKIRVVPTPSLAARRHGKEPLCGAGALARPSAGWYYNIKDVGLQLEAPRKRGPEIPGSLLNKSCSACMLGSEEANRMQRLYTESSPKVASYRSWKDVPVLCKLQD